MVRYNWQLDNWPDFTFDIAKVEDALFAFAENAGRTSGAWQALPESSRWESLIDILTAEALKTSKIEGETLDREDVRSSIRKNLGFHDDNRRVKDKKAAGIAALMIDARNSWNESLTQEKLFAWHEMLLAGSQGIHVGSWRTHEEPMQVVSGAIGREKVHYEAPPSSRVPMEMERFIDWFNQSPDSGIGIKLAPLRCAIAHLYFESIHPFEDGNGRIGRAIAEKALSQGLGRPVLLSLSETIEADRKAYYEALKQAQRSRDVTDWVRYFTDVVLRAQIRAEAMIDFTVRKAQFFDRFRDQLSERQRLAIGKMLVHGPGGLGDGVSASKYAAMTKTSKATATRDLQELLAMGAIERLEGGGRNTRYRVGV
jgi:Fic family protein